jgi:ABC-type xylose transport system permease subunit
MKVPAVTMFITFIILYIILHKTIFGRQTYAMGGNEKAALDKSCLFITTHSISLSTKYCFM